MRAFFAFAALLIISFTACSQELYTKTYGKPSNPAVVFLHGGPGYNSVNFEGTTAQALADLGFYVIIYDRRGEGRSDDSNAQYTFKQSNDDLNAVLKKHNVSRAALLGHSFGGIVGCHFAQANPDKVQSVILISTPLSFQGSFDYIREQCLAIYTAKGDVYNLGYLAKMDTMDKASIEYSSFCFNHAMINGLSTPKTPSAEAVTVKDRLRGNTELMAQIKQVNLEATKGYWKNEAYTTIDLTSTIKKLKANKVAIYGIYGKEDGLNDPKEITALQNILGTGAVMYIDNCGHNPFIDQQTVFLNAITQWAK